MNNQFPARPPIPKNYNKSKKKGLAAYRKAEKMHKKKVRELPCGFIGFKNIKATGCKGSIEAHHYQGKGGIAKGKGRGVMLNYKNIMPACTEHHHQLHAGVFLKNEPDSSKQDAWQEESIRQTNILIYGE